MKKNIKSPSAPIAFNLVTKAYSQVNITVALIGDDQMRNLNKTYKGRDYSTDVLSFEIKEELERGIFHLGEIAVNIDQAKRQASEFGNDLNHEVAELVEHGTLHLLGVHHVGDGEE